jgi:hypothetical protein
MAGSSSWVAPLVLLWCAAPAVVEAAAPDAKRGGTERVRVAEDRPGFVLERSGRPFVPWGFNYSTSSRLIEDFWDGEWETVAADFAEMKGLGANVVRLHIQFAKFMDAPGKPNEHSLKQLGRVLKLAEDTGLYLDVTGLGCFRKEDVPAWYDAMSEADRWAAQATFWEAIAGRCAQSPALFCYDLMNEPLVPAGRRKPGDWLAGKLGPFWFLQYISLDQRDRPRHEVAREWIKTLSAAIRRKDPRGLITVGLLPSTPEWGHFSGFTPQKVAGELDFVCVHVYPKAGKVDEAVKMLEQFAVGKPVVVEETFPLSCSAAELKQFLLGSRKTARGWIGHYEGKSIEDLEALKKAGKLDIGQGMMLEWLRLFRDVGREMLAEPRTQG